MTQWFWSRRYVNFINVFSLFRNHLPLEKGRALHLNKLETTLLKNALCPPRLVEICPVVLEKKKIFLISSLYFRYFVIISPWKTARPFIWTNFNPFHPRGALCQVRLKFVQRFCRRMWKCEKFTTTPTTTTMTTDNALFVKNGRGDSSP